LNTGLLATGGFAQMAGRHTLANASQPPSQSRQTLVARQKTLKLKIILYNFKTIYSH
jgi:hypothetical protein